MPIIRARAGYPSHEKVKEIRSETAIVTDRPGNCADIDAGKGTDGDQGQQVQIEDRDQKGVNGFHVSSPVRKTAP